MTIDPHALTSIASTLEEITERLGTLANGVASDDDALLEIVEVQRQLTTASRRLNKVVHRQHS